MGNSFSDTENPYTIRVSGNPPGFSGERAGDEQQQKPAKNGQKTLLPLGAKTLTP